MNKASVMVVTGLIALASAANAASIGVNFGSNETGGSLLASDSAGVVAQINWNNTASGSGSASSLIDNSGSITTAGVTWSSWNSSTWHAYRSTTTGDDKLMTGYLDPVWGDQNSTATVSSIPYSLYDVYVYLGSNNNGATAHVTDGTTIYDYTVSYDGTPVPFPGFVQTTATDDSFPVANYAKFSGLTSSSVTVTADSFGNGAGMFGLQIVQVVPEPMSATLLGLGGLGLILAIKRRRV
jgi:hypothetical protein